MMWTLFVTDTPWSEFSLSHAWLKETNEMASDSEEEDSQEPEVSAAGGSGAVAEEEKKDS